MLTVSDVRISISGKIAANRPASTSNPRPTAIQRSTVMRCVGPAAACRSASTGGIAAARCAWASPPRVATATQPRFANSTAPMSYTGAGWTISMPDSTPVVRKAR